MNEVFVREMLPARLEGYNKVGHFKTAVLYPLADMFLDGIFNIGWPFFFFFRQVLGAFLLVF